VRGRARSQLNALVTSKLATARAWILKETFQPFWRYKSVTWAGYFLKVWTERALRSRIEPMRKVARRLRNHEPLLLNWFKAKGEISSGAVEGLNNKIRVVTRRAYGFRRVCKDNCVNGFFLVCFLVVLVCCPSGAKLNEPGASGEP
jgi:transposase